MAEPDQEQHPLAGLDRVIHSPARLMVVTYLYTVEFADYVYLAHLTGLTWGNLASHISKLEAEGYVEVKKKFVGKKPHSIVKLTATGRAAFQEYKHKLQTVLDNLAD